MSDDLEAMGQTLIDLGQKMLKKAKPKGKEKEEEDEDEDGGEKEEANEKRSEMSKKALIIASLRRKNL